VKESTKKLTPLVGLLLFVCLGCGPTEIVGVTVEQVKKDLVGQSVTLHGGINYGDTRFDINGVQDLVIKETSTDKAANTQELHAQGTVTQDGGYPCCHFVRCVMVIGYKHFEEGWKIQSVAVQPGFLYNYQYDPASSPPH
jgi:hypothetical protein